jgi:hypothetical protein
MPAKTRFASSLILFSAFVYLTGILLFSFPLRDYFLPVFYILVFYFMLLTLAGRLVLENTNLHNPASFNTRYFMVRWVKVMIHLIFIIIYFLNDRDNILSFILTFMACYILYSLFDAYTLSIYLKKSNIILIAAVKDTYFYFISN